MNNSEIDAKDDLILRTLVQTANELFPGFSLELLRESYIIQQKYQFVEEEDRKLAKQELRDLIVKYVEKKAIK